MLIHEKISAPDTLLKLSVALDDALTTLRPHLQAKLLPRDRRGGRPALRTLRQNLWIIIISTCHHRRYR